MNTPIKLFIALTPILVLQQAAIAQNLIRGDFTLRLDEQQTTYATELAKDNSVEEIARRMFKYNNIYGDSKSKIQIQNDGPSLDLNCFNCLIQHMGPENYAHSPDNKEIFVP